ncbi:hypothetical protein [Lentiprolixibacter aurantiacus]|uniref:Uncharacterized protein n=1 Tax=Lentiprolixibacter aurantiacus TaxID=2993939 RepID=A0AAE3MJT0_9FLAO|nr:hypothetical protein [Lentiprolixibacter aurantiacus]MCX2719080.1 hypothetical protein [Lentiprolixibacter aurantiacus]
MHYRPTILNIASFLLIVVDNYTYWTSYFKGERYEYGFVALVISVLTGLFGLLIDLVLQKKVKNFWVINGIGLLLVTLFVLVFLV